MSIKVEKFTHHNEPYGDIHMVDCVWEPIIADERSTQERNFIWHCQQKGLGELTGTVVEGSETSRLFWATHTRDLKGEQHSVWAVSKADLEAGYKRTAAM